MNKTSTADQVADAVFNAIERGDTASLASLWADDITHDDGRTADLPVAIFGTVREGLVTRIYEYFDSAHVAAAFGR